MPLFTIDAEKCHCDGLCARECPVGCIVFEKDQLPVPHDRKYAYCLECGHCMAVCPTGAFQLERFVVPARPKDSTLKVSAGQAVQFLTGRRSVRAFRPVPLEQDVLQELLDVTEYAPSGHNARPVRWSVASTPEKVHEIAGLVAEWMRREVANETELAVKLHLAGIVRFWDEGTDLICRNAPVLAVAHGPKKGITPLQDGVIGVTYLELAAYGMGLGACWCGYVNAAATYDETVRHALGVGEDGCVFGSLMLGKPARRMRGIPPRPGAKIEWL